MRNLRSNDIFWLAGLLEGEAWFGLTHKKYPSIRLYMTDLDIVQKARNIMNSSTKIHTVENKSDHKTQYMFSIDGQLAIEWMMTLYSLMGSRRKERIRETLKVWKEYEFVDKVTRNENISKGMKTNRMIKLVMMSRKISREEARKVLEDSLTSVKQTIN